MKTLTVRLPVPLVAEIDAESRARHVSRSDVVRERLQAVGTEGHARRVAFGAIEDLVGAIDGLPADLARRKKAYLKSTGYGRARRR